VKVVKKINIALSCNFPDFHSLYKSKVFICTSSHTLRQLQNRCSDLIYCVLLFVILCYIYMAYLFSCIQSTIISEFRFGNEWSSI